MIIQRTQIREKQQARKYKSVAITGAPRKFSVPNSLFHETVSLSPMALYRHPQAIEFLNMHKTIFENRLCNMARFPQPRVISAVNDTENNNLYPLVRGAKFFKKDNHYEKKKAATKAIPLTYP